MDAGHAVPLSRRRTPALRQGLLLAALAAIAVQAGAVTLRYRFKAGDTLKYDERVNATGGLVFEGLGGQQNLPLTISSQELRSLVVKEPAGDGAYWLESRSLRSKSTVRLQGETQDQPTPPVNFRMRVSPLGEVLEMEHLAAAPDDSGGLDLHLNALLQAAQIAGFPEADARVGDQWEKNIQFKGDDGKAYQATVANRLLEATGEEAKIESRYEVPVPPTDGTMKLAGMDVPIRIEGKSSGKTVTVWNLAQAAVTKTDGTGQIDLKLTLMGLAPAEAHFLVTIKSELAQD